MRRFTIWSIALAVLIVVVFNVQAWIVLRQTSRVLEQELGDRLLSVARELALQLTAPYTSPAATALLGRVLAENNLFNLFIVDESLTCLANARDPTRVGQTDPALQLDEAEIAAALDGLPGLSRLYHAGPYVLKTAYVPLIDSTGGYGAVLGAEADARFFRSVMAFRRSLLLTNTISLIAVVAIVLLSLAVGRQAMLLEHAASRANTLALMGQLSAAVAHEIRNPLAIILSAAERLQTRPGLAQEKALHYIIEEVGRLNQTLTNYLSLGTPRPDAIETVNLASLIEEVLTSLAPVTGRQGIRVETDLRNLPPVVGNRLTLRQAFLNIVLNSIQAQPEGGLVSISGTSGTRGRRRTAVVRIEDRGPGIPPQVRRHLFDPFHTTREKGSGLGLFVVKRVVEQHGGRVSPAPAVNGGTVVEVTLPA